MAASPPASMPHGHAHLHSLGHAYPIGEWGRRYRNRHDTDVDGDEDIDSHSGGLHSLRHRQEQNIEVDVEEEGDVDEEEGRGLLVFGRCRGCGGRSSSTSIWFRGVLRVSTTTVMRSMLTTACMALRLLGTRTDRRWARRIRVRGVWGIVRVMGPVLGRMARDGVLVAMKREEEEMSVSFSVREEDEEEEEETEAREEEKWGGAKRWSGERRREGWSWDMDWVWFPLCFFFLRPSKHDTMVWMDVPLLWGVIHDIHHTTRHTPYTIHGNGGGGGGVGRRAFECVIRAVCQLKAMTTSERSSRCSQAWLGTLFLFPGSLFVSFLSCSYP